MKLKYIVKNSDESIKQILKNEFNMSDRFILKLKNNKSIFLNGLSVPIYHNISGGDVLEIIENFKEDNSNVVANSNIDFKILYEDDFLLIVDKPSNLAVHPSILHYEDSLSNGIKFYFDKIGLKKKIRPVNRLDRDTSGIVIFAKSEYVQECLVKQMKQKIFKKKYFAFLEGLISEDFGTINACISRKADSIIEREVCSDGEVAISHFRVIDRFNNITWVEFSLETGRTHQLRVHSKYIGHPIIGDFLYGGESDLISRQALHAYEVSFIHPITKKTLVIRSKLPEDMSKILVDLQ